LLPKIAHRPAGVNSTIPACHAYASMPVAGPVLTHAEYDEGKWKDD
jgi:hypothetical protein